MAKTKIKKHVLEKMKVQLTVTRTDAMYLRSEQGTGELGSYKVKIDAIIPAGILVTVDKEQYLFSVEELTRAAVEAHEKRDKEKKGRFA